MNTQHILNLTQFLNETDMSLPALAMLSVIQRNPNQNVSGIAILMQTTVPSASSHIDKLRQKKLVTLVESEEDRRVKTVAITELGSEFLTKTFAFATNKPTEETAAPVAKKKVVKKKPAKKTTVKKVENSTPANEKQAEEVKEEVAA